MQLSLCERRHGVPPNLWRGSGLLLSVAWTPRFLTCVSLILKERLQTLWRIKKSEEMVNAALCRTVRPADFVFSLR